MVLQGKFFFYVVTLSWQVVTIGHKLLHKPVAFTWGFVSPFLCAFVHLSMCDLLLPYGMKKLRTFFLLEVFIEKAEI